MKQHEPCSTALERAYDRLDFWWSDRVKGWDRHGQLRSLPLFIPFWGSVAISYYLTQLVRDVLESRFPHLENPQGIGLAFGILIYALLMLTLVIRGLIRRRARAAQG